LFSPHNKGPIVPLFSACHCPITIALFSLHNGIVSSPWFTNPIYSTYTTALLSTPTPAKVHVIYYSSLVHGSPVLFIEPTQWHSTCHCYRQRHCLTSTPPQPKCTAIISHSIPANVSMCSGLYKASPSSPLPHLLQVLTQSHTTVSQPANITHVFPISVT